jgi:Fur family peroxide stress response transcriptional regulator
VNVFKENIRSNGLRITPARVAVLSILNDSQKPLDIAAIYKEISKRHVDADQATIYRIVDNFIEKDMIKRLQFGENKFYYEAKGTEHHHAICTNCGKIEDVVKCNIKRLEKEILKNMNFNVASHSLEFYGLCEDCSEKV